MIDVFKDMFNFVRLVVVFDRHREHVTEYDDHNSTVKLAVCHHFEEQELTVVLRAAHIHIVHTVASVEQWRP